MYTKFNELFREYIQCFQTQCFILYFVYYLGVAECLSLN